MANASGLSDDAFSWTIRFGDIKYSNIVSFRVAPPSLEGSLRSVYLSLWCVFVLSLCWFLLFGAFWVGGFEALNTLDICDIIVDLVRCWVIFGICSLVRLYVIGLCAGDLIMSGLCFSVCFVRQLGAY